MIPITLRRRFGRTKRGQALVETAVVLPILLFMALLTFDVGRAIFSHIALTEATQEGSLYAAHVYGDPDSPDTIATRQAKIQTRVSTSTTNESVANATVTVFPCSPTELVVRSEYELPVISPFARLVFGPTIGVAVEVTATNLKGECP